MRRLPTLLLVLASALALAVLAGCGEEEAEGEAIEGEPIELGELRYNVQLTRFLNPASREDRAYLQGLPDPPLGKDYLAVFMRIQNEGDEIEEVPTDLPIVDTRDQKFEPIETDNPFALPLGEEIPPHGEVPAPDTPAASGPIKGSMVLYLIEEGTTENRPLELEIPDPGGEPVHVELDL